MLSPREIFFGTEAQRSRFGGGGQLVEVGKSARGSVLQQAERREAAASEWELSRSTQTVQTLLIQEQVEIQ